MPASTGLFCSPRSASWRSRFYFLEKQIGAATVPIAYPEYFYGFVGTALSAQILFLIISMDPARFRPAMVACVIEKLAFGIPVWKLWSMSRVGTDVVSFGSVDLVWAALFRIVYFRLGRANADGWEHSRPRQLNDLR